MAGPSTVARDINIPYFVQNQILRAEDLNTLVRAFKQQLRQSRVFTIGAGVINGLKPSFVSVPGPGQEPIAEYILLSGGLAISSDGYMFDMQSCKLTHFKQKALSNKAFGCGPDARSHCMDEDDLIDGVVFELEEFSENNTVPDGWTLLKDREFNLDDYCLILLWCERQVSRQSCFNECEEKGADSYEEILKILIPSSIYKDLLGGEENGEEEASPQVSLTQNPQVKRFGYDGTDIDLCSIGSVGAFYKEYRDRCLEAVGSIAAALSEAYNNFFKLTKAGEGASDPSDNFQAYVTGTLLGGPYKDTAPLDNCTDIQYLYTYLRELVVAYLELKSFAHGMIILNSSEDGAALSDCLFPGHVSLGSPTGNVDGCPATGRIKPDIYPDSQERLDLALCLFERLAKMADEENLNLPTLNNVKFPEIRVTPSSMQFRFLRRRALPFYYHDSLKSQWDCHEPSYSVARYLEKSGNPLLCELESYDFYRIEGHLGDTLTNVLGKLKAYREDLNIPFDIQCVRLGPAQILEEEKDLVLGELDEVYINTRADILCKIDELEEPPQSALDVKDILEKAKHIGELEIPNLEDLPDESCPACLKEKLPEVLLEDFLGAYQALVVATASNQGEPSLHADLGPLIEELARKYHTRRIEIEQQKSFPCFAKAHPGLEHMGGVPRGGTFVLVYTYQLIPDARGYFQQYFSEEFIGHTDEYIINAAIGNSQIKIEEIRKRVSPKVTADFCLPYLCCSDTPVIRNEIRTVRPQIIGETIFCFDDFTANPPTYNFTPEGGVLKVFVNGVEKYSKSPMELDWTFDPDLDLIEAEDFIDYKATVKLEYFLGSEKAVKNLVIFNTPNVNGWSGVKLEPCIQPNPQAEACQYGFKYRIGPPEPISVTGLDKLILCVGEGEYPIDTNGEFDYLELCIFYDQLENGVMEVQIKVENGPCKPAPGTIIIKDVCPSWGEIPILLCHYQLVDNIWQEGEMPIMGGGGLLTLNLPDGNYPGILELKQSFPGGTFKVSQGAQAELPNIFATSAQPPECDAARSFFVYDKNAAALFLNNPAGPNIPFPGDLNSAGDVILNDPNSPLKIDYSIPGCGILSFNLALAIIGPEDPENEPINRPILNVGAPSPSARAELSSRQDGYRQSLDNLAADMGSSTGFKKANIFLSSQGEVEALTKDYLDTANSLSAGQASAAEEKKPAYTQVMSLITLSFLDKLASTPAETVDEQAIKAIRDTIGKSDIKPAALKKQWKAAGLRKVMNDRLINFLNDQIK